MPDFSKQSAFTVKSRKVDMAARILSGKVIADAIKSDVVAEITSLRENYAISPGLAVVRVGDDRASSVYVASKVKTSAELGMFSEHLHLASDATQAEIEAKVDTLNSRDDIDGILV